MDMEKKKRRCPVCLCQQKSKDVDMCESCGINVKNWCTGTRPEISLTVNGKLYNVGSEYDGAISLCTFLRESRISMGTKYMCKEGGCGACLVQAQLYEPISMERKSYAVTSCLVPLFSCDGWEITTIEGIDSTSDKAVPKRLAQYNGSQCGFCSPGQVMNMHALMELHGQKVTSQMVEDELDSVICRCTGYRSILDAMKSYATDVVGQQQVTDIEDIKTKCGQKTCQMCTESCNQNISLLALKDVLWYKPTSVDGLVKMMEETKHRKYKLVFGNTGSGVYKELGQWNYDTLIDLRGVKEMYTIEMGSSIVLGANLSLTQLKDILNQKSIEPDFGYFKEMSKTISKVATNAVRNLASWAGNLMLKYKHPEFQSDIYTMLETVGTQLEIAGYGQKIVIPISQFLNQNMCNKIIVSMTLTSIPTSHRVKIYKVNKRNQNAHSDVNAGMNFDIDEKNGFLVKSTPTIVFGGISKHFVHAAKTEEFLNGKSLCNPDTLKAALSVFDQEAVPDDTGPTLSSLNFRKTVASGLLYRFVLDVLGEKAPTLYKSGALPLSRPISSGQQSYDTKKTEWPLTEPMTKVEAFNQSIGKAEYINDLPKKPRECYAEFVLSTEANAKIQSIDPSEALKLKGVIKFLSAKDIPGENNVAPPPFPTEEALASDRVEYNGQPVGIIVAETPEIAKMAAKMVKVVYTDVQPPILTMEDAIEKESIFPDQAECIILGNADDAIQKAPVKVTGRIKCGAQYHMTLETQIAICNPTEDGLDVYASTQWITRTQEAVAMVLGQLNSRINVNVRRLGGAFGSKITRNLMVVSGCALAADAVKRPVRLNLDLSTNMKMLGKRSPWMGDYTVGLTSDGMLQGIKITYYSDCGINPADNSLILIGKGMDNAYHCPNWHAIPIALKTNTPMNTFFRAPGCCPTIFIMESIMEHCAKALDMDPTEFRIKNLYHKDQITPAQVTLPYCKIRELTNSHLKTVEYDERKRAVEQFNEKNRWKKKGLSVVPLKFGVIWTEFNYTALVVIHGYDGSVSISHGGIESGQGINTKVIQVCAHVLGIPVDFIQVKPTDSLTSANSYLTGGSVTSELCCKAVLTCCEKLKKRIEPVKLKMPGKSWKEVIFQCFTEAIDLSERYWEAPCSPEFSQYNSYGVTLTEVTLDILTGQRVIDRVDLLYDCGQSINPHIDMGQVEGAFVIGLGYFLQEEVKYDQKTGNQLTNGTWDYKVPMAKDIPVDFRISLLKDAPNPLGVLSAKACGEPPLCMSCSALFAIKHAIEAFRRDIGKDTYFALDAPATVEKVQQACSLDPTMFVI